MILFLLRFGLLSGHLLGNSLLLLLTRLAICSLCILTICYFSYFPLWFRGAGFGSLIASGPGLRIPFAFMITYIAESEEGQYKRSLVVRKPVFGVSDQVKHKLGCTVTEDG